MKRLRRGEKGFTLIELLIVVAILGILAAAIVPNLVTFLASYSVAAANTEVAKVRTAATGYFAKNAAWPASSDDLYSGDPDTDYLNELPKAKYTFDDDGLIGSASDGWEGLTFVVENQEWVRSEAPTP